MRIRNIFMTVALSATALILSGCLGLSLKDFENHNKPEDYFDFATSRPVKLDIQYGDLAAQTVLEVYANYPLVSKGGETYKTDADPVFKYFTDAKGAINTTFSEMPSYINEGFWIYSGAFGVPAATYVDIQDGVASYTLPTATKTLDTKVVAAPQLFPQEDNFYSIVSWTDGYGTPVDGNQVMSNGILTATDMTNIKKAVWNGSTSKPSNLDNSKYAVKSTSEINTTIAEFYKDDSGKAVATERAEVYLHFAQESGWNQNVLGYYYYPEGEQPANPSTLKKYIIFPNASISGNPPYGATGFNNADYGSGNAPISANKKVQLLYEDEDGNVSKFFPPKTTIGYFIIANAWTVTSSEGAAPEGQYTVKVGSSITLSVDTKKAVTWTSSSTSTATVSGGKVTGKRAGTVTITASWTDKTKKSQKFTVLVYTPTTEYSGHIDYTKPIFYSDKEWNARARCMRRDLGDLIVYGFEDNEAEGDVTMEDIVFTISANPEGSLKDCTEQFEPDPDDIIVDSLVTTKTYCYEDLWPGQGDYDLNDVIVEHKSKVEFDAYNYVIKVTDRYTVEHQGGSAGLHDAFAVVIPSTQRGNMMLPETAIDETETSSIIIFENGKIELPGNVFEMKREFAHGILKLENLTLDLDPYIIPQWKQEDVYLGQGRREVHMPKKSGTSKINQSLVGTEDDAFFVYKDGKHPYALTLPVLISDGTYTIPTEKLRIEDSYPRFANWVESEGEEDTDWYLHYGEPAD